MTRAVLRGPRAQAAVLLLACLLTSPAAWADDYLHISHALRGTPETGCPYSLDPESRGGDPAGEPEAQHDCSCLVCILVIVEANASVSPSPVLSVGVNPYFAWSLKQYFSSEIYHPPLA